jgi:hypothetical protein
MNWSRCATRNFISETDRENDMVKLPVFEDSVYREVKLPAPRPDFLDGVQRMGWLEG